MTFAVFVRLMGHPCAWHPFLFMPALYCPLHRAGRIWSQARLMS